MAKTKRGQGEPTVIKKYANRRLYDTGRSSYVTLDDLCEMLKEGYEFVVYDAKTGEDITHSVLTQIMAEKETEATSAGGNGQALLPTGFLKKLITFYGDSVQGLVPNYLESTLDIFVKNQERMREQLSKSLETMPHMKGMFSVPGMEEMSRQNMAMIERTMKMFSPLGMNPMTNPMSSMMNAMGTSAGGSTGSSSSRAASHDKSSDKEQKIRELRQNIAEMQKELNRMAAE